MRFLSTRDRALSVTLSQALRSGIAPDGGLFLPVDVPTVAADLLDAAASLPQVAERLLRPYFAGDALEPALSAIVADAFNFPVELVDLPNGADALSVLELFHGPTAAFKDFGARFLAACLERLPQSTSRRLTILVATSGDTGGAVAAAFHRRPWVQVVILYPQGLVSPRQERQLTCWDDNVRSIAVRGTFDDCQRLVKEAFADPDLRLKLELSSANSINIGRLLPQAVYYAWSSLQAAQRRRRPASYIVPSGNLGNVFAAVLARRMGLPIADLILAHNANRTVPDFLASGDWQPRPSIATLASAMDVGNPSNMERLRAFHPDWRELAARLSAVSVDDVAIRHRIQADFARYGQVWCPHTATAAEVYSRLPAERRRLGSWILVATAHPAKFSEIVEPLVGQSVAVPPALARLLALPTHAVELAPELGQLKDYLTAT